MSSHCVLDTSSFQYIIDKAVLSIKEVTVMIIKVFHFLYIINVNGRDQSGGETWSLGEGWLRDVVIAAIADER